jgi:hypothetical protein
MININRTTPPLTTANGGSPYRAAPSSAPQHNDQLIYDGVVASYIHDISARHRYPSSVGDVTRRGEEVTSA